MTKKTKLDRENSNSNKVNDDPDMNAPHTEEWHQSYEVGIPDIDKEHRMILSTMNEWINNPTSDLLMEIFEKIGDHFTHEEKIMEDLQCPQRHEHGKIHMKLRDEMKSMEKEWETLKRSPTTAFMEKVKSWIIFHLEEDRRDLQCKDDPQSIQTNSAV